MALAVAASGGCYDTGDGSAPPSDRLYFPVGLQVSHGGTVLYAVNSDFDLQYNGGTLQAYDLRLIRQHALLTIANPADPALLPVLVRPPNANACPGPPEPGRQPLGETCAPPVRAQAYIRDSVIIGAFATELLLSPLTKDLVPQTPKLHANEELPPAAQTSVDRLFAPVRGNATLTWATIARDDFTSAPAQGDTKATYAPFRIQCGQDAGNRCDGLHAVGDDPNEQNNTRRITLPGEPFGATISEDGTALVMTHQNDTKTSLFLTGLARDKNDADLAQSPPSLQFVVDSLPVGGVGITPVPHDRDAFLGVTALPRPAFFQTSRSIPQVSLLRQYADDTGGVAASTPRPFLDFESAFPISASANGADSRGIVVDPTPRLACKAKVTATDEATRDREIAACARKPARAFIANRSPAALLVGEVGANGPVGLDGVATYDPDRLRIHTSVPLSAGPSKVYIAPIVDKDGAYALRVFAVCFDSATVFVYDPDAGVLENVIRVGVGPFSMAFDPFDLDEVARHVQVPIDARDQNVRRYRFAYLASFTQSYVQVIDLDNAVPSTATFERVVFTLGEPTNPKGS
ncbi:MAG: hypothetical protein KIT84_32870 [Labilithrix sp.]|nr:hypothetical protein [Labilithrix sp.]MCW5815869.1 hypothetical protein [Labilithrix sp.]